MALAARHENSDGGSRYVTDRPTILQALRSVRDQRLRAQLRFDGVEAPFSATVLDLTHDHFLLEDAVPRAGLQHLHAGTPFSLSARGNGLYLYIERARSVKPDSERGVPYFWVKLPTRVVFRQRRRSPRIELALRVKGEGARMRVAHEGKTLSGTIIDLSAGGVRAQFSDQTHTELHNGQVLQQCVLDIRDQLQLRSKATVRHALLDARRGVLNCGFELTEMSVTDRRRLEQYVDSLSRK